MRVVAVSCVRDELDIIEPFVRHTLASVDHLVILDNGSTDGTRQILQQLIEEGLPLEVVDDPSLGHYQWQRMTHLMRAYALDRLAANWILPLDIDEFLTVPDLAAVLPCEWDRDQALGVTWQSYVPHPRDDPSEKNLSSGFATGCDVKGIPASRCLFQRVWHDNRKSGSLKGTTRWPVASKRFRRMSPKMCFSPISPDAIPASSHAKSSSNTCSIWQ